MTGCHSLDCEVEKRGHEKVHSSEPRIIIVHPRSASLVVTAALFLAGCAAPSVGEKVEKPSSPSQPFLASTAMTCPSFCFEANVATDAQGRIFVTSAGAPGIARSPDDGKTFSIVPAPPVPKEAPPRSMSGDQLVQVGPNGDLYYSALLLVGGRAAVAFAFEIVGIQVAVSKDAGASWASNAYLSAASASPAPVMGPDRQWLSFAPDGQTIYVSYHQNPPVTAGGIVPAYYATSSGIWVARSDDAGRTFSGFQSVVWPKGGSTIGGPGIVDPDGRFFLPTFVYEVAGGSSLRVAMTSDKGQTWQATDVIKGPGTVGDYFPVLAADSAGRLVAAWKNGKNAIELARSEDHGKTWSKPIMLSSGASESPSSPWVAASGPRTSAAWYENTGDKTAHLVLSRDPGASDATTAIIANATGYPGNPSGTDFASFAVLPDGRVVMTWVDFAAKTVGVAVELRP